MANEDPGEESGHTTDDHIRIDIRHWESEFSGLIIYRIPRKLRKVNQSAYTPQLVSIGPFHYGNGLLSEMETVKSEYYYPSFLKRFDKKIKEDDLKKVIKDCSDNLRHSYEGIPAKLLGDDDDYKLFEEMILRDACFILELFLRNVSDSEQERKRDCILRIPWLRKAIKLDLILLENQIPFFVLEKVYQVVKEHLPPVRIPSSKSSCFSSNCDSVDPHMMSSCRCFFGGTSLTCCQVEKSSPQKAADHVDQGGVCTNLCNDTLLKLTLYFFEEHYLTETCGRVKVQDIGDIKHFTDLIREFWLPRKIMENMKPGGAESITERKYLYSATKLDTAGVTFEPARKGTCLSDVKISKKKIILKFIPIIKGMRLKLPELKLENDTESLLRNVMALEQCLYPDEDYICGYVALMDQLINTGGDVEFLVDKKILTNLLGSHKEAAKLINGLCNQIPREKSYYARFYNELNTFYENRWNVTRATLKKVYFKDLWTGSSTVVGLFVLLFTVSATLKNVYFRHL
ncbi:uncharacterized protein LOC133816930 [Humulus lupulus]|uniref:uncharacterized protein LOC133816930 n=1 Tax=Humulus lupulus TaxID=3486 RepID=UPI002B4068C3|nr:uncharacterized protein LOC133816930 [Humulus lupulus]